MSNQKLKSENYNSLGGINNKYSPYILTPLEFLKLENYDFQTPGALSQRWGSTQYVTQNFSGEITSLFEYQNLNSQDYIYTSVSGAIYYGVSTAMFQSLSLSAIAFDNTYNTYFNIGRFAYSLADGLKYRLDAGVYFQDNNKYGIDSNLGTSLNTIQINTSVMSENKISYQTFQNYLYLADGNKFLKSNGTTLFNIGLPYVTAINTTLIGSNTFGFNTDTLNYKIAASYVNNRGFEGPITPLFSIDMIGASTVFSRLGGGTFLKPTFDVNTPVGYGISSINIYVAAGLTSYISDATNSVFWNKSVYFLNNYAASGSTLTTISFGTTVGGMSTMQNNYGSLYNSVNNTYYPLGFTAIIDNNNKFNTRFQQGLFYPQYLEVYKNSMFLAGFSSQPSTVYFSDVGEPEGYPLANNFEVRTNDADYITCMKSYSTRLYIFKKNSFFALLGDNVNNFSLQEVSVIYGCLNNRSAVIFENLMVFLDRKGLMLYNGANIECLSDKIQDYFDRMNYDVALDTAIVAHDKLRNQVVMSIPIDGSSTNNITLVYDYLVKAWTTQTGYNASVFATIQGYNNTKNLFYGSYDGTVNWFGPSFLTDNGVGFTLSFKTRFIHDIGDSVQKQFRRLYINSNLSGVTLSGALYFYQDYGASVVKSVTFNYGAFQQRIDFGISAKSLAYELQNINNSNSPLKIFGFTLESRLQRRV